MKIRHVVVWDADLGNNKPYTIAFKTIDEVKNVFVKIYLDNGITGIGAGNPSEYVTGESYDSCLNALKQENIEFLQGADICEFYSLQKVVLKRLRNNPAARAAIDIALWDAFTKYLNVPLVKFLGQRITSMPTSVTVGIKNAEETLKESQEHVGNGFRVLKIKLGRDLEEDVERLKKLRENFQNNIVIRVDANQGYTYDQTMEFYNRTRDLNLELIEQPLPARQVEDMKKLPDGIRNVIAADESLLNSEDALSLIDTTKAAGIFNIKLMKCGGVSEALKIANIAKSGNVDLFWGCNDESIVSIAAALQVAFSCENTKYLDLDGSLDLARDIVVGGFQIKEGVMYCLPKPGLGVEEI